jgi:hypothetical protein
VLNNFFGTCSLKILGLYSHIIWNPDVIIELIVRVILFVRVFGNLMHLPSTKSSFGAIIFLVAGL